LKDLLKDSINPKRDKLYDVTTLMANFGVNAAKVFAVTAKIGGILVRMGYRTLKRWSQEMHNRLDAILSNSTQLTPEQIDEFIKAMWDCPFNIDGEVHKVSEWADRMEQEELRKHMKMSIEEKRELQKKAEGTKTILCDLDNIRESLPFLLPAQQEDVEKAEIQFFDDSHKDAEHGNGKGYMFTNGTGTGKTYTGLGIAKRFLKQGKKRILIVTAQESKIRDFIRDAKNLGIEATMLPDTKSKGSGVVVTQYANMYQNYALLEDTFDLIIYDESHKLMENQNGTETSRAQMHHMLANRDAQQVVLRNLQNTPLFIRGREIIFEMKEVRELLKKADLPAKDLSPEDIKALRVYGTKEAIQEKLSALEHEQLSNELEQESVVRNSLASSEQLKKAQADVDRTKVVFLSATPFNTALSLDYAEGYIFSYPRNGETTAYETKEERRKRQGSFVMNKFGSSHSRTRQGDVVRKSEQAITDPNKVNEEEIAFSDYLQNDLNVMSGRALDSEYDYSREFPLLNDPASQRINKAISELTRGQYKELASAFKHLLNDYPAMTALFEIIKTKQSIERIKQHLALGRKVAIYHRRRDSTEPIVPPFVTGIEQAKRNPSLKPLAERFERDYADLLRWEQTINYSFPNEQIVEAFATEEEKATYAKEIHEWMNKCAKIDAENKEGGKQKKHPPMPKLKAAAVAEFNGDVNQRSKDNGRERFNDDNSECKIMVCQIASAKEGIDLHDKTGKHQRVLMSLALPESPIEFVQVEGRIYRIGSRSDAIFEYPILGIDLEISKFAMGINGRSQTEENLALGSKSRGLRDSIMRAVLGSREIPVGKNQGKGGKVLDDRAMQNKTGYEDAVTDYDEWAGEKKPENFDDMEVPNPIGYKMMEWAKSESGESVTVPYARRGTIARYAPGKSRLVVVEDDMHNVAQLAALVGGGGRKIIEDSFENYAVTNKTDCLVMCGPHSVINDGQSLIKVNESNDSRNLMKAWRHLEEGGRIVAVVSADQELQGLFGESAAVVSAEIALPDFVFNGNKAKVVVIDKVSNKTLRDGMGEKVTIDLSDRKDQRSLFADLKAIDVPPRTIDKQFRVRKRVLKVATKLNDSPVLAKIKISGKMRPHIYSSDSGITFYVKNSATVPTVNPAGGISFYNGFSMSYRDIADGNYSHIQGLARQYQLLRRIQNMSYDEASEFNNYRFRDEKMFPALQEAYGTFADMISAALGKTDMQIKNIAEGRVENEIRGEMTVDEFEDAFKSLNSDNVELSTLADRVFAD
jgi:hypothetical protein